MIGVIHRGGRPLFDEDDHIDFSSLNETEWRRMVWRQLRFTNGNVRELTLWRAQIKAVIAVMVVVLAPTAMFVATHFIK